MDVRLIVKAMGELSTTLSYDDHVECTQIFGKYIQRRIEEAVKDMPYGARYSYTKYDNSTQTFKGVYEDNNIVLSVKIPVDCWYVDVSQIIEAHQTEGYVFTIGTIQSTQERLKEVIMNAITPIREVIRELKGE